MTTIALYIAISLDGYIARKDGSVDWLSTVETGKTDYGYADFYQSIDALVMGRKTYQTSIALSSGEWAYPGKPCYVFTHQPQPFEQSDVFFTTAAPDRFIQEMETQGLQRVWLVGGAELTASFLKLQLIDEFILSIVPLILGEGIPLFTPPSSEVSLTLTESQQYPSGLVQLKYKQPNSGR
jgi:dihydrofolate reductase